MRTLLIITLFFTSLVVAGQVDSIVLKDVMKKLDKALLEKDEAMLKNVLHKDVSYGHSKDGYKVRLIS